MTWTLRKLVAVGGLAGLCLALFVIIPMPLVLLFGPFMATPVCAFLFPMMFILSGRIVPEKGSVFLLSTIMGLAGLALPLLGPPGFVGKLLVLWAFAAVIEAFEFLMKRSLPSAILAGFFGAISVTLVFYYLAVIFSIPGPLVGLIKLMLILGVIEGAIGGLAAHYIYEKIKDRSVVKSFRD